jgi:peptidoglycan/LPS O-acetylase OafA/YrhL
VTETANRAPPLHSLTGLRFLAALAVFISHVREHLFEGATLLLIGGPAVSFFFVLSGFILTWVYHEQLAITGTRRFYLTRLARIWPLHLACLLLAVILVVPLNSVTDKSSAFIAQLLLVHAWFPVRDWMHGFNSVSWSISTEAFFYLAFPWLLAKTNARPLVVFFLSLAVASALVLGGQWYLSQAGPGTWLQPETMAICHPLVRLPEFVLGILTCRIFRGRGKSLLPAIRKIVPTFRATFVEAACFATIGLLFWQVSMTGFAVKLDQWAGVVTGAWLRVAMWMGLFAVTIAIFALQKGAISRLLGTRTLIWLGEISYAFYLVHHIVVRTVSMSFLDGTSFVIVTFLISLSASAILYRLVEIPWRQAILAERVPLRQRFVLVWNTASRWLFGSPVSVAHFALLAISASSLWWLPDVLQGDGRVQEVIARSEPRLSNIRFKGEATLLGATIERGNRGRRIRLVWRFEPDVSRQRVLHVIDGEGRIVSSLPPRHPRLFGAGSQGTPLLDEFWLPNGMLTGARAVVTGFWSPERGDAVLIGPQQTESSASPVLQRLELFPIKPRGRAQSEKNRP